MSWTIFWNLIEYIGVGRISYELHFSNRFAKGLKDIIRSGEPEMKGRVKGVFSELKNEPIK